MGIDINNLSFGFDEHTRFVRHIFRAAGYASNPNAVLCDEEKVTELKSGYLLICKQNINIFCFIDAMKKRDKTLQDNEEALDDAWQAVKESVRQLKHDHKRNKVFQTIRTSSANTNTTSTSSLKDTENNTVNIIGN